MRVPNAQYAWVAPGKITDYLLSTASSHSRGKAGFFSRFGFESDRWEVLADALRSHCVQNDVAEVEETVYGTQYVIVGPIDTPDGRNPVIRTVWQVDHGADYPRFITARPDR